MKHKIKTLATLLSLVCLSVSAESLSVTDQAELDRSSDRRIACILLNGFIVRTYSITDKSGPGDTGALIGKHDVYTILDTNTLVLGINDVPFVLHGFPTSQLRDGSQITVSGPLEVARTNYSYMSVTGKRTTFLLTPTNTNDPAYRLKMDFLDKRLLPLARKPVYTQEEANAVILDYFTQLTNLRLTETDELLRKARETKSIR
jgi:hypothetical protein